MSQKQCPRCKQYQVEEVPPTSVWEHLVPEQLEVHEYVCFRCKYSWITERERFPRIDQPISTETITVVIEQQGDGEPLPIREQDVLEEVDSE